MSINYTLRQNNLTIDPDDYCAQVRLTSSADLAVIADLYPTISFVGG